MQLYSTLGAVLSSDVAAHLSTYGMKTIFGAAKMYHTIQAGECAAATVVPMGVELLLGQDISAALQARGERMLATVITMSWTIGWASRVKLTSHEKETISTLADPNRRHLGAQGEPVSWGKDQES